MLFKNQFILKNGKIKTMEKLKHTTGLAFLNEITEIVINFTLLI